MVAHAADELADLAGFCEDEAEELDPVKDWAVEKWDLSDGAKAALIACYDALLAGDPGRRRLRRGSRRTACS